MLPLQPQQSTFSSGNCVVSETAAQECDFDRRAQDCQLTPSPTLNDIAYLEHNLIYSNAIKQKHAKENRESRSPDSSLFEKASQTGFSSPGRSKQIQSIFTSFDFSGGSSIEGGESC
mmetsp:Transcript_17583/g.47933  ORF Transcript_17583/g.47933 Transcript_17583/m.47933 type:complete len:117 (-) Transcript_17583:6083-6433(-)